VLYEFEKRSSRNPFQIMLFSCADAVKSCKLNAAAAFVALQNYLFQVFSLHNCLQNRVDIVCFVVWRDFCFAFWTEELASSLHSCQINRVIADCLQCPFLFAYLTLIRLFEGKSFMEQCSSTLLANLLLLSDAALKHLWTD